ncbi:phosphoribosylamine--glycine ligase [Catellatospora tritici]|uniref:phosphoribosylamine--glycine ligase n=1 Tax=Catellatospora tritici TaxID=2851566 RepID=UPI001C2DE0FB|nr:phosphoribosylamine--glycine ligase [Catellatospora tritici]MBV1852104.1 phosphoribosylamine--glycine ligase [Catellatospora tritici]
MRVLVVGGGGREHALVLGLVRDPQVTAVIAAPGNPGIAEVAQVRALDPMRVDEVARLAVEVEADLVVVGPEAPLVAGAADAVRGKGIPVFGPSAAAARIEGSKDFAKQIMVRAQVPTARAYTCTTPDEVAHALDTFGAPYVVKDDGLAAGKGVVVTEDREAALRHAAGCARVVVEEFLDGPEVSLFVVTDGENARPLLPAQDFKRIGDGDTGPNTGGMGAYAPLPWAPPELVDHVMDTVVHPTLRQMRAEGHPFQGLLYVGLAITKAGPKVIEFNCRFGDPETQSVLALLETPLGGLLHAAATHTLAEQPELHWAHGSAVTVVVASAGYPEQARTGDPISGAEGLIHAGTARDEHGVLRSSGGRVLCATATGHDLASARAAAYELAAQVDLPGGQYRTDIALAAQEGRVVSPWS